jgi:RNA polymerase sigma factor (sigma-70 family)
MNKQEINMLFKENEKYIKYIVSRYLLDRADFIHLRDDMIAEANLKFISICRSYDPDGGQSFSTYLYDQITFHCNKVLREELRIKTGDQRYVETMQHLNQDVISDEYYHKYFKFFKVLEAGLATEYQKELITMYYIFGMTYEEIAKVKGVTKQAVQKTISKALKNMKEILKQKDKYQWG